MTFILELPEDVLSSNETERLLLEALLISEYRAGRVSAGYLGDRLGLDFNQREAFLSQNKAHLQYDDEGL